MVLKTTRYYPMNKIMLLVSGGLMLCLGGCGIRSGANGELVGVQGRRSFKSDIPYGMVYVPPGTFLMGQTDQDITYSNAAPNRQVSVSAFYMEIGRAACRERGC